MEKGRGYSTEEWMRQQIDPLSPYAAIQEAKDEIDINYRLKKSRESRQEAANE